MATKAELEAELEELKRQLAEQSQSVESPSEAEKAPELDEEDTSGISEEFEALLQELSDEVKNSPHIKLALGAVGIFIAGMILGRTR